MDLGGVLRRRWAVVAAVAGVLAGGGGLAWAAADGPAAVRAEEHRIQVVAGPGDGGRVTLDATFFAPAGRDSGPAVLLAHGFGGSKADNREEAEELARAGYAVLTWSARGFGRSTGEIALNSPDHEVQDARQLVDWLARRPEVVKDRAGDPRVGIAGESYGGALALLAAAHDPRVDAVAPQLTWHDLADALFPDATGSGPQDGVFKRLWAGIFFTSGGVGSSTPCGRFRAELCAMYQEVAESGRPTPEAIETLRRSSPAAYAARIKAPTLLVQGQSDSLFPLDHADANARAIARNGTPVAVAWIQGGHDGGDPETERVRGLVRGWFDRYLRGDGSAGIPAFAVSRNGGIDSSTQEVVVESATASRYPGLGGAARREVPLTGPEQTIFNPAGGSPPSISALPGLGALDALGAAGGGLPVSDMPGQIAAFDSRPLDRSLRLTGAATVRIRVRADRDATLFAKLYDVAPDGRATPARRLAAPLRVSGDERDREVTVTLPPMDRGFDRGHRLRLVLSTTDLGFATPAEPATFRVSAVSGLTVPAVPALRTAAAPLPAWVWGLPLAALALAAGIGVPWRRGRGPDHDPALADVPLQITGLTKRYPNGHLAVDDLSLRVEQGQVLGLLGPNGAGKTTTLRMLMGLVHPDAGQIRIFGDRVTPGAPVLSRLGSFVEGPGFLPHLTGRANLDLYWRATGRPAADAHMDEALAIAGLGAALDRPVRTYSQGMRQRLAIAQAMLGLPDLLVLDEPTNGLDPPQIREMREVLVRYAATGRTVIVSSHLLAEVEQTCTHAVVMSRGRRVAAGPVAEIVGSGRRLEDAFLEIIGEGSG
ncbi:alpha/beta fold hydrolase [Thermomonospora cellulosilytica]|uniref:ABC-2 type transport system ATP-binding protein n=1 Tax=Thermomonospora cellulosilytica TaxID=1411118 RepID=A0A7W3MT23_9ACTN|nr:alpha/beta fold hydrolase [Thermomonospora cellulosilytica]MBA9001385.1 ABC-2 type transport system ATP-binding protein [Thermomonospora cellulosilytica]